MDPFSKRLIQKGSPFELQDAVIKGIPCKIFPYGPRTLLDVFLKAASFKQSEFIISGETRLSFEHAIELSKKFAHALLHKYGVKKGERIAILMKNSPEWAIVFIAIYFACAVPVIIHADGTKEDEFKAIEVTNCALVISDSGNVKKVETICMEYPVIIIYGSIKSEELPNDGIEKKKNKKISYLNLFEGLNDGHTLKFDEISKPEPDDESLISFTSGTTGTPKGVVLTHRNMTTGLMNMMLGAILMSYRAPKDKIDKKNDQKNLHPCSLVLSPFSHIGGYSQIMLMCYLGGKIVLINEWNTNSAATIIENESVSSLNGAPPNLIREMLRSYGAMDKLKTLTNLNIHGTALNQGFLREVTDEFPYMNIGTSYGMTETCGSISTVSGYELLHNPNWIGPLLPSVEIKVIDVNGIQKSQEEVGEVCVRGAMIMKEYCADHDNTKAVLMDSWLKTGDLGYMDVNGNLYITDRIKDIIICGNHHVSAGELERLACEHPMIDEAVIIGIPSSEECESIVLAVLLNNTRQINEKELKQEVSSLINKYSDNIKIVLVDSLPRTASGKINRNELRKQINLVEKRSKD